MYTVYPFLQPLCEVIVLLSESSGKRILASTSPSILLSLEYISIVCAMQPLPPLITFLTVPKHSGGHRIAQRQRKLYKWMLRDQTVFLSHHVLIQPPSDIGADMFIWCAFVRNTYGIVI